MNLEAGFQWLLSWIQTHPTMAVWFVFVVACAESLAVIGIVMPGALLMLSFGALIALDALPFWPTFFSAVAGAVVGDGVSYWLGYHYRGHIRVIWPFSKMEHLFRHGETYFIQHGGKSVALGRFVGPVRAIIPTIAGMMGMSPKRFIVINVISALAWAPAYLIPGMIFAASMELAAEIALRLVVSVMILIALLVLVLWLIKHLVSLLQPRAQRIIAAILVWNLRHPLMARLTTGLIDPSRRELKLLSSITAMLTLAAFIVFTLIWVLFPEPTGFGFDRITYQFMSSLRTPWIDSTMIALSQLGSITVTLSVGVITTLWLYRLGDRSGAMHLILAMLFGLILSPFFIHLSQQMTPAVAPLLGPPPLSITGTHLLLAMTVYGFISILIAGYLKAERRSYPYIFGGLMITGICVAQLYLGLHWLSDVVSGLLLGLVWVTLVGIGYRRHLVQIHRARSVMIVVSLSLMLAMGYQLNRYYHTEFQRLNPKPQLQAISTGDWTQQHWQTIDAVRNDLRARHLHPINLQWAADLNQIQHTLSDLGWSLAPSINVLSYLQWLNPNPNLTDLPILPQVHNGRYESLLMIHPTTQPNQLWAVRFWPSQYQLQERQVPVWAGSASTLELTHNLGWISYPATASDFNLPIQQLAIQLNTHFPKPNLVFKSRANAAQVLLID